MPRRRSTLLEEILSHIELQRLVFAFQDLQIQWSNVSLNFKSSWKTDLEVRRLRNPKIRKSFKTLHSNQGILQPAVHRHRLVHHLQHLASRRKLLALLRRVPKQNRPVSLSNFRQKWRMRKFCFHTERKRVWLRRARKLQPGVHHEGLVHSYFHLGF